MNPILTCTDGSLYARSVYHYAAWAASRLAAPVHVLHMLDAHRERAELRDFSGNLGPGGSEDLLQKLVELEEARNKIERLKGEAIIEEARRALGELGVKELEAHQLHGGLVEHLEEATGEASLLVIGKRGEAHGKARLHLGSNLERAIRASRCPVLVASMEPQPQERFLIAYDGGQSSQKALDYILEQPLLEGMACHLVRVGHATPETEEEMAAARKKLAAKGYDVTSRTISGEPAHVFKVLVEEESMHLLVMGAFGHSKIRQFLVGSTTTEMIRSCRIPVLMFR